MRKLSGLLTMLTLAAPAVAQPETATAPSAVSAPATTNPVNPIDQQFNNAPALNLTTGAAGASSRLKGDTEFPNFIGFVSNPTLALDPRALTQLWPVFADTFNK